jgi:hypothetical protein
MPNAVLDEARCGGIHFFSSVRESVCTAPRPRRLQGAPKTKRPFGHPDLVSPRPHLPESPVGSTLNGKLETHSGKRTLRSGVHL